MDTSHSRSSAPQWWRGLLSLAVVGAVLFGGGLGTSAHLRAALAPALATDSAESPRAAGDTSQWLQLSATPPGSPAPGAGYAVAYDPAISSVVLFGGGQASGSVQGYTWLFARGAWTNVTASVGAAPSPRTNAAMAADPQVGGILLYGGLAANNSYDTDTWSFSGGHWKDLTNSSGVPPSARFAPSLAYDSADQEAILFGGETYSASELNETWAFSHGNWTNLTSAGAPAPTPRRYAGLADDPAEHGVLLFGGQLPGGTTGDTWIFGAGHWSNLTASLPSAPPARRAAMMAYDSTNQSVLLFGGDSSLYGTALSDTWRFQAGRWWNLTPYLLARPSPRFATGMSDDPTDNGTVLIGGCTAVGCTSYLGDSWVWIDVGLRVSVSPGRVMGSIPLRASFTASVVGGLAPYEYFWRVGSGPLSSGSPTWNGTFATVANTTVSVTISDRAGGNASATGMVVAQPRGPPPPPLAAALNQTSVAGIAPLTVRLRATVTGGVPPYTLTWQNGTGALHMPGDTYWNGTFSRAGTFVITLLVLDSAGNLTSANTSVKVGSSSVAGSQGLQLPWNWVLLALGLAAIGLALAVVALRRGRGRRTPSPGGSGGPTPPAAFAPPPSPGPPVEVPSAEAPPIAGTAGAVSGALAAAPAAAVTASQGPGDGGSLTLSNRLLLHLYGLGALRPSDLAPIARTQEGIAAALTRPQGSFARVLQRLEDSGLIVRELRHVQGKTRRVQVYMLTDRGYALARELRSDPTASGAGQPVAAR